MNYITPIIKRILGRLLSKELPLPVGRWKIESCNKKMDYKVDLSNEDHCGPCGQYALNKITNKVDISPLVEKKNNSN